MKRFKLTNGLHVVDHVYGLDGDYTIRINIAKVKDNILKEDMRGMFRSLPDHNDFNSIDMYLLRTGQPKKFSRYYYEIYLVFNHFEHGSFNDLARINAAVNDLDSTLETTGGSVELLDRNWEKMILCFHSPTKGILDVLLGNRTRDNYEDEKMDLLNHGTKKQIREFLSSNEE